MNTPIKVLLAAMLPFVVIACGQAPEESQDLPSAQPVEMFDAIVANGRVMDPASGLDAVRHIGIRDGRIAAISETALNGEIIIDAADQVVAPGFVDLHSHGWTPLSQRYQLLDGVTTALELESGAYPAASHGIYPPIALAERPLINYGASTGHAWVRSRILEAEQAVTGMDQLLAHTLNGTGTGGLSMGRPAFRAPLTADQIPVMQQLLREDLANGGLGIGMLLDYMSEHVSAAELRAIFEVAAETDAPVIVHIRRGVAGDPFGLDEVIGLAGETGAAVHVCHLQASAMGGIEVFLGKIRAARQAGVRVTTESFPYNAGSTSISAAVFSPQLARDFRHRLRRRGVGGHWRAPDGEDVARVSRNGARRHGHSPLQQGTLDPHRHLGRGRHRGQRRPARGQRSATGRPLEHRHLRPGAGPLRARRRRLGPDDRLGEDDHHARPPT